jgi:hypothetical protein
MDRGLRAAGALIVVLTLVALSSASAGATVVSLGSDSLSYTPPRVVVDAIGTGNTSWADGGSGQALETCRLAPHAARCEARHTFTFPGVATSEDSGNAPVVTADGQLAVLDSRCCLMSNQKELLVSADHGTTFTGPTAIVADHATGMTGNLLDLPAGTLGAGSPEQLLTSSTNAVTGGGSIQATGLAPAASDPGWFTPPIASGSLSQSIGRSGSTVLAVYTSDTTPHYTVFWVRYQGGDPNAAASWTAAQPLSPAPSLDSDAQLAGGPAGIVVVRSIALPGDNERLVVQRFTGSGWSHPVPITNDAAGQRFAITQTPTGIVYVIWKDTSGPLRYAVAKNRSATKFGKSVKLATRGEIEYPQIAVNGEGAGWATWTDDHTPSHVSALPIVPRPKVTRAGALSLQTPRECVAIGGVFPVTLAVSGKVKVAGVQFSVSGGNAKTVARSPYRATLTLTAASKAVVAARVRLPSARGHTRVKLLRATLTTCP